MTSSNNEKLRIRPLASPGKGNSKTGRTNRNAQTATIRAGPANILIEYPESNHAPNPTVIADAKITKRKKG